MARWSIEIDLLWGACPGHSGSIPKFPLWIIFLMRRTSLGILKVISHRLLLLLLAFLFAPFPLTNCMDGSLAPDPEGIEPEITNLEKFVEGEWVPTQSGTRGETIGVVGFNFGDDPGTLDVFYNEVSAEVLELQDITPDGKKRIVTTVPRDLPLGPVPVFVEVNGSRSNEVVFVVTTPRNYPVGNIPVSMILRDFNKDGIPDLAVANQGNVPQSPPLFGSVSVLMGNGDGTFSDTQDYDTGTGPSSTDADDFDGDDELDLVTADKGLYVSGENASVSLLFGNGDGTFQDARNFTVGHSPVFVAAGDLDQDDIPDLVVVDRGESPEFQRKVLVLIGNGDGTFQEEQSLDAGDKPVSVALGDLNADHIPDLAVADRGESPYAVRGVSILLGNGDGTFQEERTYEAGANPASIMIEDLDGDDTPDLALVNRGEEYLGEERVSRGEVSVLLGNGDGTFQAAQNFASGFQSVSLAVGDLDHDENPDLAVANFGQAHTAGNISVLVGNGDGTFQEARDFAAGLFPFWVVMGNLDEDDNLDLVVANSQGGNVSVLLGDGDGGFDSVPSYGTGQEPVSIVAGDLDGDTSLDLVVANEQSNDISVFLNNGDGTFGSDRNRGVGDMPSSMAIGDLDKDNNLDLAVANASEGNVTLLLGNGDGTFQEDRYVETGNGPVSVAIEDLNNDNNPDLVVVHSTDKDVAVFPGNGDGTFQAAQKYTVEGGPGSLALGDLNGDGFPDLIVTTGYVDVDNELGGVTVFLNDGIGAFPIVQGYVTGDEPSSAALGDLNGDLHVDLVVANKGFWDDLGHVSVFPGNGDGTFQEKIDYDAGINPRSVALGDMDGDEDLDIAVAVSTDVSVLFNNEGNGTFPAKQHYTAEFFPCSLVIGDLDGDGDQDIAAANKGSDSVSVLFFEYE